MFGQIFVNQNAAGANNGTSWTDAFTDLQEAIDSANSSDQIWVATGTYYPTKDRNGNASPSNNREKTFYIDKNIQLYGGFIGTETQISQRNWNANLTFLSGNLGSSGSISDNSYHVVRSKNLNTAARLDGFGIKDGFANTSSLSSDEYRSGAGIYNHNSDWTIANCFFTDNKVLNSHYSGSYQTYCYGGGMYNDSSDLTILNCLFADNTAQTTAYGWSNAYGGAIYNQNSNMTMIGCYFDNNRALASTHSAAYGGAIFIQSSMVSIKNTNIKNSVASANTWRARGGGVYNNSPNSYFENVSFQGNSCSTSSSKPAYGGGIYNGVGASTFVNCLFSGNKVSSSNEASGAAMMNISVQAKIINCTFSGNYNAATTSGSEGGGIYNNATSSALIINSILWNNQDKGGTDESAQVYTASGGVATILHSCVEGLTILTNNNSDANPKFVAPEFPTNAPTPVGNYQIQITSPIINAGLNDSIPAGITTDLYGNQRIKGGMVDLGIHESSPCNENDSLELVYLYNEMAGLPWNLAQPMNTWQGVFLSNDGCYVIGLDLSGMNLSDTFPEIFFDYLHQLHLNNNQFTFIDCNYDLPMLFELHLEDNAMNFDGGMACILNNPPTLFTYSPQSCINIQRSNDTLSVEAGGNVADNTYKWYLNGALIATNIGNNLLITSIGGVYTCEITNSTIANLTLCTQSYWLSTANCNASNLELGDNVLTCSGEYIIAALPNMASYEWSNDETTDSITADETGWYTVIVTDSCGNTATDSIFIEFRCNYIVGDTLDCKEISASNGDYLVCLPIATTDTIPSGMIGIDMCIIYDTTYLQPILGSNNGALQVGNVISNNGAISQSMVNYTITQVSDGQICMTVFYNNLAPQNATFTGIGDLFCLEFILNENIPLNTNVGLEYFNIIENYSSSNSALFLADTISGDLMITGDTTFFGRIIHHNDSLAPMAHNPNAPVEAAHCGGTNGVHTDSLGYFAVSNQSNMLAFKKDIHTPSFIDVLPVINSQDIYLAQQVAAQANFGLSVWEYIAMDANGDGVITGLDAYNITQRIFQNDSSLFKDGADVRFVEDEFYQSDPIFTNFSNLAVPILADCYSVQPTFTGFCDAYDSILVHAVVVGDVDNSWTNTSHANWKTGDNVKLRIVNATKDSDCNFYIPVGYGSLNPLTALDSYFELNSKLTVLDVIPLSPQANNLDVSYTVQGNQLLILSHSTVTGGIQTNQFLYHIKVSSSDGTLSTSDFQNPTAYYNGQSAALEVIGDTDCNSAFHTAVEEVEVNKTMFKIFPNPATDAVIVESLDADAPLETVELLDMKGQVIQLFELNNKTQMTLDISKLANAVYMIRVNRVAMERIVKVK